MACRSLILILTLVFTAHAYGLKEQTATLIAPANQCACPGGETVDRLENPSMFNFGHYTGTCIDSCRFRRSEVVRTGGDGILTVSNLMHAGKFWTAHIPDAQVTKAEVGFEEFMPGIYHVFLLFNFNPKTAPRLQPQAFLSKSVKIESVAFSPEGIPPQGGKYNFVDAFFERYLIGYRLLSKEQLMAWSSLHLGHKINLYKLNLSAAQATELFHAVTELSGTRSFGVKYGLFSNNCATSILDLLERVAPGAQDEFFPLRVLRKVERSLPVAGPIGTYRLLVARQLIDDRPDVTIDARPPAPVTSN